MEHYCSMEFIPTFETAIVDENCKVEIKYHAPKGIDAVWAVDNNSDRIIDDQGKAYPSVDKCEYDYLDYLPIIKFSNKYIGKKVIILYHFERFFSQIEIMLDKENYLKCLSNFKDKEYSFISFNKSGGIKKSKFDGDIFSSLENKPGGGLWASMYTPEKQYISAWQLYIDSHVKEGISPKRKSRCTVLFNLKDGAKIPVIDSWEDYKKLSNFFSYKKIYEKMNKPLPDDIPGDLIDYELMSMVYDGIYITKNGILDAGDFYWNDSWWNMVHRHEKETNLRAYGCESLCLFNLDCIENMKNMKIEKW